MMAEFLAQVCSPDTILLVEKFSWYSRMPLVALSLDSSPKANGMIMQLKIAIINRDVVLKPLLLNCISIVLQSTLADLRANQLTNSATGPFIIIPYASMILVFSEVFQDAVSVRKNSFR